MDRQHRTSDSGMSYIVTQGRGTVLSMEHDINGSLITRIRHSEYSNGTLIAHLITAEVEDHEIAIRLQEALYSGRTVEFETQWWDTQETNDLATGETVVTRINIDYTTPIRPRRLAAI